MSPVWALFVGLFVLAAGILAVPLRIEVRRTGDPGRTSVRLRWLFAAIAWEPRDDGSPPSKPAAREPGARERAGAGAPPMRSMGHRLLLVVRTPGLGVAVGRLLRGMARAVKLERAESRLRLGDPADTGLLWGVLQGLVAGGGVPGPDVRIEPDFTPGRPGLTGAAAVRVVPLRASVALVGFVSSPAVLRAGWRAFRA